VLLHTFHFPRELFDSGNGQAQSAKVNPMQKQFSLNRTASKKQPPISCNKRKNSMSLQQLLWRLGAFSWMGVVVLLFAGCATQKTVPPLFTAMPPIGEPSQPPQIPKRSPPEQKSFQIVIKVPKKVSAVEAGNSITRPGAIIKPGSSVVISVPKDFAENLAKSDPSDTPSTIGKTSDFRTDEYFNDLEQYIERGLIAIGLQAKDRSKFEAKLRDLRESSKAARDNAYDIALADLKKDLDSGKISREEFPAKVKTLQDKLDPTGGGGGRSQELKDISEVIRAAQSGEIMADYVLQVNHLGVQGFPGTPMQLEKLPEVQAVLNQNPGLGSEENSALRDNGYAIVFADLKKDLDNGKVSRDEFSAKVKQLRDKLDPTGGVGLRHSLPATIERPWSRASFNAKLIEVKTGSIDWSGEFSVESLAILEDGITITIVGRRLAPSNGQAITNAISEYNTRVSEAHQAAVNAKQELDEKYRGVMQPVNYEGDVQIGAEIQNRRKSEVEAAEKKFAQRVAEYQATIERKPPEANVDWTYNYEVDPVITEPDILTPKTEEEKQRKREHDKALARKVTSDLLQTIKMTKEESAK
jgi:hypothetical protein